ncbi:MAG: squalene--hopene cyclase [Deltaproteobacteria bacterium]|nr:squalene--hopene cyclase [Deltaproteobacteria bacterium]
MHRKLSAPVAAVLVSSECDEAIARASQLLLSHQTPDGYWWYTLEANESIGAEAIYLRHCLGLPNREIDAPLARRILARQLPDGSWSLSYKGYGDLSATIECYLACRMVGHPPDLPALQAARRFIARHGGLQAARVFTKIHLAMLGCGRWDDVPNMPAELILLPHWAPFSMANFSSWARACIVPLLIVMARRPIWPVDIHLAEELGPADHKNTGVDSARDLWADIFSLLDRAMKLARPLTALSPTKSLAIAKAERWIREHIAGTEDIFPALAYGALALRALGHPSTDTTIAKAMSALKRFQHGYEGPLPPLPFHDTNWQYATSRHTTQPLIHQQCCISPVWDTPWAMTALRSAGVPPNDPSLLRAGEWLLAQQITTTYGDWRHKNPQGVPGGWAFEFENDYFPDVDDTIQVLLALHPLPLPVEAKEQATTRAIQWCLSMQNDDGGWAAFDKNNTLSLVNKIPFADHGACLDPATPDITGRMLECLAAYGWAMDAPAVQRALQFLVRHQEPDGSWFGRWGVNYIYGTWAVLRGLCAIGIPATDPMVVRAVQWLESVQRVDGGFGESVESYPRGRYVPQGESVPSQTAWALMALIAAGRAAGEAAARAADWLIKRQQQDGAWDEPHHTGTGFPGHFYIRYHGYRHYFPLMALAEFRRIAQK